MQQFLNVHTLYIVLTDTTSLYNLPLLISFIKNCCVFQDLPPLRCVEYVKICASGKIGFWILEV